ncbi:MAG: TonB family protein [Sulfurisoma sp.]|nr:TonB family protein [Sulfurisoma sp.]
MNPQSRNLGLAIGASLLLHGILLSIHFTFPDALSHAKERALDVILVNSRSATRPTDVQARAQANLDGGGNTDEDRRAATPLPVSKQTKEGESLIDAQRRVTQLEAQQREMMTQLKSQKAAPVAPGRNEPTPLAPLTPPNVSGLDLASSAMAVARLEGQISRQTEEYNKRPRKKFIGVRTEEYRFAQYVEDWRQKVERIGNLNYPEAARGKMYGSLVLTVIIKADGTLDRVDINRPSGQKLLDDAARRIVQMASPYSPFPSDIARDTDILEITRTWTFTSADKLRSD